MDSAHSIRPSSSVLQTYVLAAHEAESRPQVAPTFQSELNTAGSLDALNRSDPAKAKEKMEHFISHVDAECFISLLQMQDPLPHDARLRTEYKHRYQQLRQALVIPVPPDDVPSESTAPDPLK